MTPRLKFICTSNLELYRTEFEHPVLTEPVVSFRGRGDDRYQDAGTFHYSRAVRGLLLLACEQALAGRESAVRLSGDRGSLASSLEQAISREPSWVYEMFGAPGGEPLVRRLFYRTNPNHKRPGPVSIGFRQSLARELQLEFLVNGQRDMSRGELTLLAERLRGDHRERSVASDGDEYSSTTDESSLELFDEWLFSSLRCPELFSATGALDRLKRINTDRVYRNFGGQELQMPGLSSLPPYDWVHGLLSNEELDELAHMPPLTVAVPWPVFGAELILSHLAKRFGLPILCDLRFPHTATIADAIAAGTFPETFGAVALTVATSPRCNGKGHFKPISFLPDIVHHLVARDPQMGEGDYLVFTHGGPTTTLFLYENLRADNTLPASDTRVIGADPDECLTHLASDATGLRSLLFAPYSLLISSKLKLTCREIGSIQPAERSTFLLVREGLLNPRHELLLSKAIRHAWIHLLQDAHARHAGARATLNSRPLARTLYHFGGLCA